MRVQSATAVLLLLFWFRLSAPTRHTSRETCATLTSQSVSVFDELGREFASALVIEQNHELAECALCRVLPAPELVFTRTLTIVLLCLPNRVLQVLLVLAECVQDRANHVSVGPNDGLRFDAGTACDVDRVGIRVRNLDVRHLSYSCSISNNEFELRTRSSKQRLTALLLFSFII